MRLTFLDPPAPEVRVWDTLEDEQRTVAQHLEAPHDE
jgi:hypothetical protein